MKNFVVVFLLAIMLQVSVSAHDGHKHKHGKKSHTLEENKPNGEVKVGEINAPAKTIKKLEKKKTENVVNEEKKTPVTE